MIKVGQIYKDNYTKEIYVITNIKRTDYKPLAYILYKNGETREFFVKDLERDILINHYPTWQEAVNSKEFNDVTKN